MLLLVLLTDPLSRGAIGPVNLFANVVLVHKWIEFSGNARAWNLEIHPTAWTLSTLAALYLIFPLWSRSFAKTWKLKLAAALGLTLLIVLGSEYTDLNEVTGWIGTQRVNRWIFQNFTSRLFEFTLGMTAAVLFTRQMQKPVMVRAVRR